MKLSPHFTLEEFVYSSTAIALGIDNSLDSGSSDFGKQGKLSSQDIISNLTTLCEEVLEPLREAVNSKEHGLLPTFLPWPSHEIPIVISSGYRCRELNKAVGGVSDSQHLTGEAADIAMPHYIGKTKLTTKQSLLLLKGWYLWMKDNVNYDQLIFESARKEVSAPNAPTVTYWIHVSCRSRPSRNRHEAKVAKLQS